MYHLLKTHYLSVKTHKLWLPTTVKTVNQELVSQFKSRLLNAINDQGVSYNF